MSSFVKSKKCNSLEIRREAEISAGPLNSKELQLEETQLFINKPVLVHRMHVKISPVKPHNLKSNEEFVKIQRAALLIQKYVRRFIAEQRFKLLKRGRESEIVFRTCRKIQNSVQTILIIKKKTGLVAKVLDLEKSKELIYTVPASIKLSPPQIAQRLELDPYRGLYLLEEGQQHLEEIRWTMVTRIMRRVKNSGFLFQFYINEASSKLMIKAHELGKTTELSSVFEEDIGNLKETELIKYLHDDVLDRIEIADSHIRLSPKVLAPQKYDENKVLKIQRVYRNRRDTKIKLKLSKGAHELLSGNLLIRSQKIFHRCIYIVNLYKESNKELGGDFIRVEACPLKKIAKPESTIISFGEICEILDLWENSEVIQNKQRLIKHVDLEQGKVVIARKPISEPLIKQLRFTTKRKLNTSFNYDLFFYDIMHEDMPEDFLIEADPLDESIPIHKYLCISKQELINILKIDDAELPNNFESIADLLFLESSRELCISHRKPGNDAPEIMVSLTSNENRFSTTRSLDKHSEIIKPEKPWVQVVAPAPKSMIFNEFSTEELAAITIQSYFKRKQAIELKKLLKLKKYRENHNKIMGRGMRFLEAKPHLVTVYSTRNGILVEVIVMETQELAEKLIDPLKYVFGFAKSKNIKMIIDALRKVGNKLAFLRNHSNRENIDIQFKDYSFFEAPLDDEITVTKAVQRIQK